MSSKDVHVYVIRIDFRDGTATHPVMISNADPGWETQLDDAVAFFTKRHEGTGLVSVGYARNIYLAGVTNDATITDWNTYKNTHEEEISGTWIPPRGGRSPTATSR